MTLSESARHLLTAYQNHWPKIVGRLNHYFVSIYKIFGFFMLGAILVAMTGYLSHNVFYVMNHSWVTPTTLTPSSEKVIAAQKTYLEYTMQLEKLRAEGASLAKEIELMTQALGLQQQFVSEANGIAQEHDSGASAVPTEAELKMQLKEQLITRVEYVALMDHLRQTHMRRWAARKDAMNLVVNNEQFKLKLDSAKQRYIEIRRIGAELEQLIARITDSPYYRANKQVVHIGFAPYENLARVTDQAHAPVYGCFLSFIFCKKIGSVERIYPEEYEQATPTGNQKVRGQWLSLSIKEDYWSNSPTLFLGQPPLWL